LPLPELDVVIQVTLLVAVHAQPVPVVTPTVMFPPDADTFCDVGLIEYVQLPPPPVTVNVSVKNGAPLYVARTVQRPGWDAGRLPAIMNDESIKQKLPGFGRGSNGPLAWP
jgi:hypothetical protein